MGTEGLGTEVPSGVQGQIPGEGLGAKPPEARYTYIICSGQNAFSKQYRTFIKQHTL